jgi:hypothetical protein
MQFGDGAVYAGRESEIVRIDEKVGHLEKSTNVA